MNQNQSSSVSSELAIVVRQSPDWANVNEAAYKEQSRAFCRMINRPAEQMNELVELWGATFSISFFETRQHMKEIAQSNLSQVKHSQTYELAAFDVARDLKDQLCCFVDDDDWFHPDTASLLRQADGSGKDGFLWRHGRIGVGNSGVLMLRPPSTEVFTNNYAVTPDFLNAEYGNLNLVAQHFHADSSFKKLQIQFVDHFLSVTNKHPASTVALELSLIEGRNKAKLADAIAKWVRQLAELDPDSLPEDVAWVSPQLRQLQKFASQLGKSFKNIP